MRTEILDKLSPEARNKIIKGEARLRKLDLEIAEIDLQLKNLDNEEQNRRTILL